MGISIIICCYNSAGRIKTVLQHLEAQANTGDFPWEVIVVDNASSDNTAEVAGKSWRRKDVDFKVVYEGNPGLSNARIKGLAESAYPLVVFVDDDNLLEKDYISRAYHVMEKQESVGLLGGLGIPVSDKPLPEWFENFQDAFAVGPQAEAEGLISTDRTYLHGAGLVMRKDVWKHIMDSNFSFLLSGRKGKSMSSGEDSEISSVFRLSGYELWYDPGLKFQHLIPEKRLNWKFLVRLAREFGKSFVVLDIYFTEIRDLRGWGRAKSHNWLLGTAICLYQIFKLLPSILILKIAGKTGNRKEFEINFQYGVLLQRFKVLPGFSSIKSEIGSLKQRLKR